MKKQITERLVRDHFVEILRKKWANVTHRFATDDEYKEVILEKLVDVTAQFLEDVTEEGLAEVLEVLNSITHTFNYDLAKIDQIRQKKYDDFGWYEGGVILEIEEDA